MYTSELCHRIFQSNTYNGLDTRVSSTTNSVRITFLRDGASVTDPVVKDSNATYTPGLYERRAGSTRQLHHNLKSVEAQTTLTPAISASRTYDAFGNILGGTGTHLGPFGYGGGFGYQEDATGLKLLGHRLYDSSTGRFLTRDPAMDGRNWYTYCENDPVGRKDADGKRWQSIGLSFLKGLAVGVIVAAVIIIAAPAAVTGLVALGVSATVATGVVTGVIFAGAVVGGAFAIISLVEDIRDGNWEGVAETIGALTGGLLVGGFGGGRGLGAMDGVPSPAPPMRGIPQVFSYDQANVYKPKLGPPTVEWMATKPTPGSGTGALGAAGAGTSDWIGW